MTNLWLAHNLGMRAMTDLRGESCQLEIKPRAQDPLNLAAKLNYLKFLLGHLSLHLLHSFRHRHEDPIINGLRPILPLLDVLDRTL